MLYKSDFLETVGQIQKELCLVLKSRQYILGIIWKSIAKRSLEVFITRPHYETFSFRSLESKYLALSWDSNISIYAYWVDKPYIRNIYLCNT